MMAPAFSRNEGRKIEKVTQNVWLAKALLLTFVDFCQQKSTIKSTEEVPRLARPAQVGALGNLVKLGPSGVLYCCLVVVNNKVTPGKACPGWGNWLAKALLLIFVDFCQQKSTIKSPKPQKSE